MTDRITAADPHPQREVDALVLDGADTALLEEIMTTTPRSSARWLPVLAAAAAVAVIGAGAMAVGGDTDTGPRPSNPGFAGDPSTNDEPTAEPTEPTGECPQGWTYTQVTEKDGTVYKIGCAEPDDEVSWPREDRSGNGGYQAPPRPFTFGADGWTVESVDGSDVTWAGPDGQKIFSTWVVTADPADPFAYDRYEVRGEEITVFDVPSRLTGYSRGAEDVPVIVTSGVVDDGTSVVLEGSAMTSQQLRDVAATAAWVSQEEFRQAAGR